MLASELQLSTSRWRKWSAILDMLPSMLEAHETNIVFYLNRQIFRTFWAMKSHMTQWRWSAPPPPPLSHFSSLPPSSFAHSYFQSLRRQESHAISSESQSARAHGEWLRMSLSFTFEEVTFNEWECAALVTGLLSLLLPLMLGTQGLLPAPLTQRFCSTQACTLLLLWQHFQIS